MDAIQTRLQQPRRTRRTAALRGLAREADVTAGRLIQPLFVLPDSGAPESVASMPGVQRYRVDSPQFDRAIDRICDAGLGGVLLFGGSRRKTESASEASDPDGAVQHALRRARERAPGIALIADLCLCAYTTSGHCWLGPADRLDRAATLDALGTAARSLAEAGADVIAPSGMVDGMVRTVRTALDDGFDDRAILSYAVKYASALYAPFREAAANGPTAGDRRAYQMDPANGREAIREARLDQAEGADWLMIKPALTSLDVVQAVRRATTLPIAAYSVSGEYAMVKAAAAAGWLDERRVVLEMLRAIRRAGADAIVTYHAVDAAGWLAEGATR